MKLFILYESAVGYALFEKEEFEEIAAELGIFQEGIIDFEKFSHLIKLKAFTPFGESEKALVNMIAISQGTLSQDMRNFLTLNLSKLKNKKSKFCLGVGEIKLANEIHESMEIQVNASEIIQEMLRGIRLHFTKYLKKFKSGVLDKAQLGLGHSYSRSQVQYDINRQDKSITQAIAVIDQLDKDVNSFCMRIKEWFLWHFPELHTIITDNQTYVKVIKLLGSRDSLCDLETEEEMTEELKKLIKDDELVQQIVDAAKNSMGQDMMDLDKNIIGHFAQNLESLIEYRSEMQEFLSERMNAICPNVTSLAGENVGARLISHAGSLVNLSKLPASTIQILGAEKALFRALKTKGNTPKYGLIYHSTFIGRAGAKNKGRISRNVANKLALASRIDQFGKITTGRFGDKFKSQVEERLKFFSHGTRPKKNADAMEEVLGELKEEGLYVEAEPEGKAGIREDLQKEGHKSTGKKSKEKKGKKSKKRQKVESSDEEEEEEKVVQKSKKDKKKVVANYQESVMEYNLNNNNKSNFKCIKFGDGSVYYGEIMYLDPERETLSESRPIEEIIEGEEGEEIKTKKIYKIVRHGNGLQLYGEISEGMCCQYEGEWISDKREGNGKCLYPDNSSYIGDFKQDQPEGYGAYHWMGGCTYEGNWKSGKMEGAGQFTHSDGGVLKGFFTNNYYMQPHTDNLINPFLGEEERKLFIQKAKEYKVKSTSLDKSLNSQMKLFIIATQDELFSAISTTRAEGRMPFALLAKESGVLMQDLLDNIASFGKVVEIVDMRRLALEYDNPNKEKLDLLCEIKEKMINVVKNQGILILNVDDSECKYEDLYEPDIKEFYSDRGFPPQMWSPDELLDKDIWGEYAREERSMYITEQPPVDGYMILVWSKYELNEVQEAFKLMQRVKQRFENCLPLQFLNLLVLKGVAIPDIPQVDFDDKEKSQASIISQGEASPDLNTKDKDKNAQSKEKISGRKSSTKSIKKK